jgi:Arc/MetJ family transcription regulator
MDARILRQCGTKLNSLGPAGLTSIHMPDMFSHMKTTLNIDDSVMARLRRESARTGRTMSELVETALRRLLQAKPDAITLEPLPSFNSGGALVEIADREALYRAMEGR